MSIHDPAVERDYGARSYYEPDAGPWVAYKEGGGLRPRSYVWKASKPPCWSWTGNKHDAVRFPSRAKALAYVRAARPRRPGVTTTGAERVV